LSILKKIKLFKVIDNILANFGNIRAMQRTHVDTYTENEIDNIVGEKIAESENGQLWISYQELASFNFLNTTILSRINIKTLKGGKLIFSGESKEFILPSDITEIESDFSNISNQWMTKISYYVTENDLELIRKREFNKIRFEFKKKSITFDAIK